MRAAGSPIDTRRANRQFTVQCEIPRRRECSRCRSRKHAKVDANGIAPGCRAHSRSDHHCSALEVLVEARREGLLEVIGNVEF